MSRREPEALIREHCEILIKELVKSAFVSSPLPNPPLELPDFPAIQPKSSQNLVDQTIGLYLIDRAGFKYRLSSVVNDTLPDHVKRNIDPEGARQKWMYKNVNKISETLISRLSRDWLSASLDEEAPDTDRWYMGVSLLIGLAISGAETARTEGFHLLSSIAMAKKPGTWATKISGPHHIDWSPEVHFSIDEAPHPSGVLAASNILDSLVAHEPATSRVLPYWLEALAVNEQLCGLLEVNRRLSELLDKDLGGYEPVIRAAIQLMSSNLSYSTDILRKAALHNNVQTRKQVASSLERIASEDATLASYLMDSLLNDEDSDVRVISTTYMSSLVRYDVHSFTVKAKLVLEKEDVRMTKRIVDSAMREYLSIDSYDKAGLLPLAWRSSEPSTKSRISSLIIQLSEANPEGFIDTCMKFRDISNDAFEDLRSTLLRRDSSIEDKLPKGLD